jgi:hypothetical protein
MYLDPFLNPPYERNEINERTVKTELAQVCELTRTSCKSEHRRRVVSATEEGERDGPRPAGFAIATAAVRSANFAQRGDLSNDLETRAMTADNRWCSLPASSGCESVGHASSPRGFIFCCQGALKGMED